MTSTDQHYAAPVNASELLGATHAWRAVLRQAAAQLAMIGDNSADASTRRAIGDVVDDLQRACALLTTIDTTLDSRAPEVRRRECLAVLAARARPLPS